MPEPARPAPAGTVPRAVACPFCEQADTRLLTPFGGQLSVAQYWCNRCRTGFDYLKGDDDRREED